MALQQQISDDLKTAMKARDRVRTATLRLALAAMKNAAVEAGRGPQGELSDDEVTTLLQREAKRRREAATAFRDGGRTESADAEEAELVVIEEYLPAQLGEDELAAIVDEEVAAADATSVKDMGRVIKAVMDRVGGQADGKRVSTAVKARLAG